MNLIRKNAKALWFLFELLLGNVDCKYWSHNRCCYYFIDNVKNTSEHHNNAYIYKLSDSATVMLSK